VIAKGVLQVAAWLVILVGVLELVDARRAALAMAQAELTELTAYAAERR